MTLTPKQITDIESHLRNRGLDPDKIQVIIDTQSLTATFLLYNLSGQLVGYQRYNPNGDKKDHTNSLSAKYYTYVTKEGPKTAKLAVWGVDNIDPNNPNLYITEGIFDAIKLKNAGLPVIAVLGNNPKVLKSWLTLLHKNTIAITDNDDAGKKLGNLTDEAYSVPEPFKDLGDMSQDEVSNFLISINHHPKRQHNKKVNSLDGTIRNPETDNDILIRTALKYDVDHPAHIAAIKKLKQ